MKLATTILWWTWMLGCFAYWLFFGERSVGSYIAFSIIGVCIALLAVEKTVGYMPRWIQRWFYNRYKKRLMAVRLPPLMEYPFHLFVELNLDSHFEEGGIFLARKKVEEWPKQFTDRLTKVLTTSDEVAKESI